MKRNTRTSGLRVALALTAAALGYTTTAAAEDEPGNTVRIGMYAIFYHVNSTPIQGPFLPSGVNLNVDLKDTQTLYLAYIRRLTSFLDLELAFGIPPKTTTVGKGPATVGSVPFNGQEIATRLSLTSSVGPVGTIGIKYAPSKHWHAALSYSISQVDTNLKADTLGEIHTSRVHFGPQALVVAAGYSF
jgi:outer membrane protein W